jgi:hypothetical protein
MTTYNKNKRKKILKMSNKSFECSSKKSLTTSFKKTKNEKKILKSSSQIKGSIELKDKEKDKKIIKNDIPKKNMIPLLTEISLNSINTSSENNTNKFFSSRSNSLQKNKIKDLIKIQDELLEFKLQNSRLQNEILILKEKNKSLNNIIEMKNIENEILINKYKNIISDLNNQNSLFKEEFEKQINFYKENNLKQIISIKSLLKFSSAIFEIFLNSQNKININSSNNIAESSIDFFDSNIDEDRKNLFEQIKELYITKINLIKNNLNINFDFSFIDKFKDYNSNQNNFKMNLSNVINSIRKNNDDFFNSFSSNKNSNDFDLSVSKSFYNIYNNSNNISPKFNTLNIENGNNKIINYKLSNNILNDEKNYLSDSNINEKMNKKNHINILDYSVGDIVNNEINDDIQVESFNKIDSFKNIKPNFE